MKRVISEQRLNSIISEAIQEAALRNRVRQIVAEELSRMTQSINEKDGKSGKKKETSDDENSKTFQAIIDGPHSDKYNVSDFGREVLGDHYNMSDDALRSLASKIARGERKMPEGLGAEAMQWIRTK